MNRREHFTGYYASFVYYLTTWHVQQLPHKLMVFTGFYQKEYYQKLT